MLPAMSDVELGAAAAYPTIAAFRSALAAGEWDACRHIVGAATPAERTACLRSGGEADGLTGFLTEILVRDPADTTARVLLAYHFITVGWNTPGGAFLDWLRRAEVELIEATARDRRDPAAWVARLITARGLELGLGEVRRRYDRLAAADPYHLAGQRQLLQSLCPKWGGSWSRMFGFARQVLRDAPPGGPHASLIVDAHMERYLDLGDKSYLSQAAVRDEIAAAAEHSVLHPRFRHEHGWVSAANAFACYFSEQGDTTLAAAMFRLLGPYAEEWPWEYFGDDPVQRVRDARERAMC